jgi:hypothetical protein
MANPTNPMQQKNEPFDTVRDQSQNKMENMKDRVRDMSSNVSDRIEDLSSQSRRIFGDASERVSDLYDMSSDWVQQNRVVTTIALAAVAGVVGFFIGRGSRSDV